MNLEFAISTRVAACEITLEHSIFLTQTLLAKIGMCYCTLIILNVVHYQMGSDEARYYFNAIQHTSNVLQVPNSLDPYHVAYLMADDGTSGQYNHEPKIRGELEHYIKSKIPLEIMGANKGILLRITQLSNPSN